MKAKEIKVGFCVAYDWYLLKYSLPLIYKEADLICLSLDKDRISWAGSSFQFDEEAFHLFINKIDENNKIKILEADFHLTELTPMENEVRQRNLMADFMKKEGWHIQLDADEYFIDFGAFVKYLNTFRTSRPINICCPWYTLFKTVSEGYIFISGSSVSKVEFIPIASNKPFYEFGRGNQYFNIKTDFFIIHQSWAREKHEIEQKLSNWGHKNDFDSVKYLNFWEGLNEKNFLEARDFHPIDGPVWEKLEFVSASSLEELIAKCRKRDLFKIPHNYLRKENSLFFSRVKALLAKTKFV